MILMFLFIMENYFTDLSLHNENSMYTAQHTCL